MPEFIEMYLMSLERTYGKAASLLMHLLRTGGAGLCFVLYSSLLFLACRGPLSIKYVLLFGVLGLVVGFSALIQLKAIGYFIKQRQAECDRASQACEQFYNSCRNKGIDDVESSEWKEMVQASHDLKIGLGKF